MLPSVISHMNVPAPPLKGLTGTAVQVPGVPGTGGGPVLGVRLGVTLGEADGVRLADGLGEALRVGDGLVLVGGALVTVEPVQVTPLRVNEVGAGLAKPFQFALKPKAAVP